jgi:hypothetical protein
METIRNIDFSITKCDISEMISESNRFLFHIILIHIITHIIDGKDELFGPTLVKTLYITTIAIVSYHILFKKMVEPKLKKIKSICLDKI